jgi:hypothetical protein
MAAIPIQPPLDRFVGDRARSVGGIAKAIFLAVTRLRRIRQNWATPEQVESAC